MRLCVFCGSNPGRRTAYAAAARDLGAALGERNIDIVYGGGRVGMMGILADAALARGGRVIGIIPQSLVDREVAHQALSELHVVSSMHERKALMGRLADAFVALPGGFGTFEELCEVITWTQLRLYDKPCHLINIDGYYDPLIAMFDRAVDDGFISAANRAIVRTHQTIGALLNDVAEHASDIGALS